MPHPKHSSGHHVDVRHAHTRLTRRDVDEIYGSYRDAHRMMSSRDPGTDHGVVGRVVEAGEVLGGAAIVGILAARLGTANIPGTSIPLGPALGVLGHGAALFNKEIGIPDSWVDHMHGVSNGLIGGWGALWGLGVGQGMREKAGLPPTDVRVGGTMGCGPVGCAPQSIQPSAFSSQPSAFSSQPQMMPNMRMQRPLTEVELTSLFRRAG